MTSLIQSIESTQRPSSELSIEKESAVKRLLKEHKKELMEITEIGERLHHGRAKVLKYFDMANVRLNYNRSTLSDAINVEDAIKALHAQYWNKLIRLTDVYECMSQKQKSEWNQAIRELKTPEFAEKSVFATLTTLLDTRGQMLAEKVEGTFRGLSGHHVTNRPEGFSKRMIISHVYHFGYPHTHTAGLIHDLRSVIAKFMGRGQPCDSATQKLLSLALEESGCQQIWDGGALKVRAYKIGTVHLEVHPEMARRLNLLLHSLYPDAIPAPHRKQYRPTQTHPLNNDTLPFSVLNALERMYVSPSNTASIECLALGKETRNTIESIFRLLDGKISLSGKQVEFPYNPERVIKEIIKTGTVPDYRSHQFYPTPREIVDRIFQHVTDRGGEWLEPQAGTGRLADRMPTGRTTCIEVSPLFCRVLFAKGHNTVECDFLDYAEHESGRYSNIVMNPPFSEGRWKRHLHAASRLLSHDGEILAILPGSVRNTNPLPGFHIEWIESYDKAFESTGARVELVKFTRH